MQIIFLILLAVMTLNKQDNKNKPVFANVFDELLKTDFVKDKMKDLNFDEIETLIKDFNFDKLIQILIKNLPQLIEMFSHLKLNFLDSFMNNSSNEKPTENKNPLSPISEIADNEITNSLNRYLNES